MSADIECSTCGKWVNPARHSHAVPLAAPDDPRHPQIFRPLEEPFALAFAISAAARSADTHAVVIRDEPCQHPSDRRSIVSDRDNSPAAVFCDDCGEEL